MTELVLEAAVKQIMAREREGWDVTAILMSGEMLERILWEQNWSYFREDMAYRIIGVPVEVRPGAKAVKCRVRMPSSCRA